ncbi:hypothetical protein BX600DRAFT_430015 [Xylariales sp. PMI_506]|nr:hypothetical protein BX600DRAFT_430015 [Xylariales sp. PMI_506]
MVVCNIHLIALKPGTSIPAFLSQLRESTPRHPVFQARVMRWMILPKQLSAGYLLGRNIHWDLIIGLEAAATGPQSSGGDLPAGLPIAAAWTAACGVSARTLVGYAQANAALVNPPSGAAPPIPAAHLPPVARSAGRDAQNLELSPELHAWIMGLPPPLQNHPVSMLNLLAFNEGKKEQYVRYGQEFSARVGARHGGKVKIAARVVSDGDGGGMGQQPQAGADGWDEIAFVHYPSVKHFAAMSSSEEYQKVNREYRLGALKDTFILCVMEIDDQGELVGGKNARGKL